MYLGIQLSACSLAQHKSKLLQTYAEPSLGVRNGAGLDGSPRGDAA